MGEGSAASQVALPLKAVFRLIAARTDLFWLERASPVDVGGRVEEAGGGTTQPVMFVF